MMTKHTAALLAIAALAAHGFDAAAQTQSKSKPAAGASQAATAAPGGKAPSSQPPAATPADPVPLRLTTILIEAVTGRVRYQAGEKAPKVIAKPGDRLREGVKISLAPDSSIRLRIGDSQLLTFDQVGSFIVTDAINDGETDITRIKLDLGRVSFDVQKTRFKNDVVIQTPDMTLAIKGTVGGIQYTPGLPTVAVGAENNNGRIELDHLRTGRKVVMTANERSDTFAADPAFNLSLASVVDTPTDAAREKDEVRATKRIEGSNQSILLEIGDINGAGRRINLPPMTTPPGPSAAGVPGAQSSLHLDSTSGLLFETMPPLETSLLRQDLPFQLSAIDGGSAIYTDPATGFRNFLYVESSLTGGAPKNSFTSLGIESSVTQPKDLGEISGPGAPLLRGLGALRDDLYAAGRLDDQDAIYRVDLANLSLEEVMVPGLRLEGALGGVSERGTLFSFAHDPGAPAGSGVLDAGAILEMDPRNNYLVAAYSGLSTPLGAGPGTSNPAGVNLDAIHSITGLAADNDSITLSAAMTQGNGQMTMLRYETIDGTPRLAEVRPAPDGFTTGVASEHAQSPPIPVTLREPTGHIDMVAVNARFAMMAYSQQAFGSGLIERALRAEILSHASNPQACAASGALTALPAILARHVDERAGIGRTLSEFRADLGAMHPCLPGTHDHDH